MKTPNYGGVINARKQHLIHPLALFPRLRYNFAHKAVTEESSPGKPDRDAGTWIEIPARQEPEEVPSRAAQVKRPSGVPGVFSG